MRGSYVYYAVEIEREREREEGSSSLSKLDLEGEAEERGLWHTICVGENMSGKEIFLHLRFFPPPPSP